MQTILQTKIQVLTLEVKTKRNQRNYKWRYESNNRIRLDRYKNSLSRKAYRFCLNNEPVNEGCDIVDYIYVLYKCSEQTDYRNKEIQKTMENAIEQIKSLYVHEDKGFSYFKNRSQTHYYGVPFFSEGLPTADLHGTILCVWGLLMALKTLKYDIKPYKIIKP